MDKIINKDKLCFKVPNCINRQKLLGKIKLKEFKGAYGTKSCNCVCSCNDGY